MALQGNVSPFEGRFGRKPWIAVATLVPHTDGTELRGGLDAMPSSNSAERC